MSVPKKLRNLNLLLQYFGKPSRDYFPHHHWYSSLGSGSGPLPSPKDDERHGAHPSNRSGRLFWYWRDAIRVGRLGSLRKGQNPTLQPNRLIAVLVEEQRDRRPRHSRWTPRVKWFQPLTYAWEGNPISDRFKVCRSSSRQSGGSVPLLGVYS